MPNCGLRGPLADHSPTFAGNQNKIGERIVGKIKSHSIFPININTLQGELGGERGIRTLGKSLQTYGGLANRCLQPLGHLSTLKSLGSSETFPNGGRNDSQMLLSTLGED
jgi:hypothetical protein